MGKKRGLAIVSSVMARYDDATAPSTTAQGGNKVDINTQKTTLKFKKTAKLRVLQSNDSWEDRGDVLVRMRVSEPHWIPDTQFQSHRHYTFSFGMKSMQQVGNSEINWDPQLTSNFKPEGPHHQLDLDHTVQTLEAQPK